MLNIKDIRVHAELYLAKMLLRCPQHCETLEELLSVDKQKRTIETEHQELLSQRNSKSKQIGNLHKSSQDSSGLKAEVKSISSKIEELQTQLDTLKQQQHILLLNIPNTPHETCPSGVSNDDNKYISQWGNKFTFDFAPKNHIELGEQLNILDFKNASKISGSGFVVYRGMGARLERALIQFLLDLHTLQHDYQEISPPFIIKKSCMEGTGQLPKFEEDMYQTEDGAMFLAPTAEVPLINLERDKLLKHEELPIKYVAYTPCFRREAGAAGKNNKGLIRMHQFDKVELVKIVQPEQSYQELETLLKDAEKCLQILGLHYRVIEICTGDLGFSAAKTYDIEVWSPGQNAYLEVSSCSNFEGYQARRMNLRFKDENGKNQACHTLNGSGIALARLFVALIENYQQQDGSIAIPKVLVPYLGGVKTIDSFK